ncbi:MAG: YgjV family protein [Patescibacteria group bacterium]
MFKIVGVLGLILITVGVLIKSEKKQDIFFILGGLALLVYSIFINDWIFIVLQIVFILTAAGELIRLQRKK